MAALLAAVLLKVGSGEEVAEHDDEEFVVFSAASSSNLEFPKVIQRFWFPRGDFLIQSYASALPMIFCGLDFLGKCLRNVFLRTKALLRQFQLSQWCNHIQKNSTALHWSHEI